MTTSTKSTGDDFWKCEGGLGGTHTKQNKKQYHQKQTRNLTKLKLKLSFNYQNQFAWRKDIFNYNSTAWSIFVTFFGVSSDISCLINCQCKNAVVRLPVSANRERIIQFLILTSFWFLYGAICLNPHLEDSVFWVAFFPGLFFFKLTIKM